MNCFKLSIEKRLIVLLIFVMLLEVGLSLTTNVHILSEERNDVQRSFAHHAETQVVNLWRKHREFFQTLARDYAIWDDTYEFIERPNARYIDSNVAESVLMSDKLQAVLIQDAKGHEVYTGSLFAPELTDQIMSEFKGPLSDGKLVADYGLIFVGEQIIRYVTEPVSNSEGTAPYNGLLTMFRVIEDSLIGDIGNDLGVPIKALKRYSSDTPWKVSMAAIGPVYSEFYEDPDDNQIVLTISAVVPGHDLLPLALEAHLPSMPSVFSRIKIWLLPKFIGIFIIGLIMLRLLRRYISGPIVSLCDKLADSQSGKQQFKSFPVERHDEIGALTKRINALFNQISSEHMFSKLLLDSIGDYIITVDSNKRITFANPAALEWLELDAKQYQSNKLKLDFILNTNNPGDSVGKWLYKALEQKQTVHSFCLLTIRSQPTVSFAAEVHTHPLLSEQSVYKGAMLVIQVVERHQIESMEQPHGVVV